MYVFDIKHLIDYSRVETCVKLSFVMVLEFTHWGTKKKKKNRASLHLNLCFTAVVRHCAHVLSEARLTPWRARGLGLLLFSLPRQPSH